jgi:hypothetical protein
MFFSFSFIFHINVLFLGKQLALQTVCAGHSHFFIFPSIIASAAAAVVLLIWTHPLGASTLLLFQKRQKEEGTKKRRYKISLSLSLSLFPLSLSFLSFFYSVKRVSETVRFKNVWLIVSLSLTEAAAGLQRPTVGLNVVKCRRLPCALCEIKKRY